MCFSASASLYVCVTPRGEMACCFLSWTHATAGIPWHSLHIFTAKCLAWSTGLPLLKSNTLLSTLLASCQGEEGKSHPWGWDCRALVLIGTSSGTRQRPREFGLRPPGENLFSCQADAFVGMGKENPVCDEFWDASSLTWFLLAGWWIIASHHFVKS
jgi:hypothetical protein